MEREVAREDKGKKKKGEEKKEEESSSISDSQRSSEPYEPEIPDAPADDFYKE